MMISKRVFFIATLIFMATACILLLGSSAFAAEEGSAVRPIYDKIMLVLNFFILAGVIIKYGKGPISNFLRNRKEELAFQIKEMEEEKAAAVKKAQEVMQLVEAGEAHIDEIKDKIKTQGQKEKQRIIEDAKHQSRYMLESAQNRINSQIDQVRERFRAELIDEAFNLATQRLPQIITESDRQGLVDDFFKEVFRS